MTQSRKIAVTGGIGSGKSYVLSRIAALGYPVFSCDEISRSLWQDAAYRIALAQHFPACTRGGEIDKAALTRLVFSDPVALARLGAFSHPRILKRLLGEMEGHAVSFAEVPLLYEGGYENLFDGVIAVWREKEARIAAVIARDGLVREEVERRMERQIDPATLKKRGCILVYNGGDVDGEIKKALDALHIGRPV